MVKWLFCNQKAICVNQQMQFSCVQYILWGASRFKFSPQTIFILYLNDICNISKLIKYILYTGDTQIVCADSELISKCE